MLDENCYSAVGQIKPPNMINVTDVMKREGIEKINKKSFHDTQILDVAIKNKYIIITRDKGLTLRAILKGEDIVFSDFEGLHLLKGSQTQSIKHVEDLK